MWAASHFRKGKHYRRRDSRVNPNRSAVRSRWPDSQPRRGWAVVRIRAASVNPSDVKNVEGQMEGTVLPRVPGRDFSGVVHDSRHIGRGRRRCRATRPSTWRRACHRDRPAPPCPRLARRLPHRCYVAADGDVAGSVRMRLIGGRRRTEHHSELVPGSPGLRLERMHASKSSSLNGLVR